MADDTNPTPEEVEEFREAFPSLASVFDLFAVETGISTDDMTNEEIGAAFHEWAKRTGLSQDGVINLGGPEVQQIFRDGTRKWQ